MRKYRLIAKKGEGTFSEGIHDGADVPQVVGEVVPARVVDPARLAVPPHVRGEHSEPGRESPHQGRKGATAVQIPVEQQESRGEVLATVPNAQQPQPKCVRERERDRYTRHTHRHKHQHKHKS